MINTLGKNVFGVTSGSRYFGELSPGGDIPTSFTTPLVNLTVL